MNKKLKKILLIGLPIFGLGLITLLIVSIMYGWYTNANQIGKIDANTKNTGFVYEINDEIPLHDEYEVENIAFFDIDSIYEGKYFPSQYVELKLTIKNITDSELKYTINFESVKKKLVENNLTVSSSYVGCVFRETKLPDDFKITQKYFLTSNTKFESEKIYYTKTGSGENEVYHPVIIKGYNISKFKEETNIEDIYEWEYQKQTTKTVGTQYYTKVSGTASGDYYMEISYDDAGEKYKTFYERTGMKVKTNDILFQNEEYFYDNGEDYIQIENKLPNKQIPENTYYEKGSTVESLFEQTAYITYDNTKTTDTQQGSNSFSVKYTGGKLETKNDEQVFYLYLFGVQEIDTATNDLFIFDPHNFTIIIEAITESDYTVTTTVVDD